MHKCIIEKILKQVSNEVMINFTISNFLKNYGAISSSIVVFAYTYIKSKKHYAVLVRRYQMGSYRIVLIGLVIQSTCSNIQI